MFTYQCDLMEWSGRATIGYYADGDLYENHPLTGSPNAREIACLGYNSSQPSQWTNLVYSLSTEANISGKFRNVFNRCASLELS